MRVFDSDRAIISRLILAECILQDIAPAVIGQNMPFRIHGDPIGRKVAVEVREFLFKHMLRPCDGQGAVYIGDVIVFGDIHARSIFNHRRTRNVIS